MTQFAVLDALLAGAYESGIPVADVRALGDTGIGCCEHLGGEVVILDGQVLQCTVDGPPAPMEDDDVLPFVDVCAMPGAIVSEPIRDVDLEGLSAAVVARASSRNLFHAVRLDGAFASVRFRVTKVQRHPLPPLAEVAAHQIETVLEQVPGTLVGFWAPSIYQGIAVAGLHLHFLAADRSAGGHVLDVVVDDAALLLAAFAEFHLHLPTDPLFLRTELTHDDDHRIVVVEGGGEAAGFS